LYPKLLFIFFLVLNFLPAATHTKKRGRPLKSTAKATPTKDVKGEKTPVKKTLTERKAQAASKSLIDVE